MAIIFFLVPSFFIIFSTKSFASESLSYFFNGKPDDQTAELLFIENDRILIPFRAIFEELGAEVTWVADKQQVVAEKEDIKLTMVLGASTVSLNGEHVPIDQPPVLKRNHVYVPLRIVAETFDAEVTWDGVARSVAIDVTSNEKLYDEKPDSDNDSRPRLSATELHSFSWVPYWPGQAVDEITNLGEPDDTLPSQYEFEWDIYLNNYESYMQIGHRHDTIDAIFLPLIDNSDKERTVITRNTVLDELGAPEKWIIKDNLHYHYGAHATWDLFKLEGIYLTVFYDHWRDSEIVAIQAIAADVEDRSPGFYGIASNELRDSYEKQMLHVTNLERKRQGVHPLKWHEKVAEVSRIHSNDMVENDFFEHNNLAGESPFDRMRDHHILFKKAGENLARRQMGPFHATYNLLDSDNHRHTLLEGSYDYIGIGVSFEENKPYFTQKFISEYEN